MGWEHDRYYTRSRRENGRVVREYIGRGPGAHLIAQMDARERAERELQADENRRVRADLDGLAALFSDLNHRCDLLARAALVAAGYHQHHRGEWRKRRARHGGTDPELEHGRGTEHARGRTADHD